MLRLSRGSMASQLLRRAGARALPVAWRFHVSRALIWWRNPARLCWTCPATAPDGVPARVAQCVAAVHRRAPSAASLRGCAAAELPDSDQLEEHVSSSATASPASVASVGCLCHQPHCLHRTGGVPAGKCQQRRLIQEAHGRAPKRDGAGLSRTWGHASKVVWAMHALQAAAACGLPHGVLQGLPHFLAAHSSTHALSSSAERLLCHFIFLSIDRADRRAAWRSGRSF